MGEVQFEGSQCVCLHARHQHDLNDVNDNYPCDRCSCKKFSFMRERTGETRTMSATGGEKGVKPERFDLIPVEALTEVAKVYGFGAEKYAANNWRKGYEWSKSYAALQRHANQFWAGEDIDSETGVSHMASVIFHAMALIVFVEEQPAYDDRFTSLEAIRDITEENISTSYWDETRQTLRLHLDREPTSEEVSELIANRRMRDKITETPMKNINVKKIIEEIYGQPYDNLVEGRPDIEPIKPNAIKGVLDELRHEED